MYGAPLTQDAPADSVSALDREVFEELVKEIGEPAASDIHAVFTEATGIRMKLPRTLSLDRDLIKLRREAHLLKSSAGTFGYRDLASLAKSSRKAPDGSPTAGIESFSIAWTRHIPRQTLRNCAGAPGGSAGCPNPARPAPQLRNGTSTASNFHTWIILNGDSRREQRSASCLRLRRPTRKKSGVSVSRNSTAEPQPSGLAARP
jgi:hypothetical protein